MFLRSSVSLLALTWAGAAMAQSATAPVLLPRTGEAVRAATPSGVQAPVKLEGARAPAAGASSATLLRQAQAWRKRGRKDLARDALDRALRAAPNDPQVLYHVALYAAQDGQGGVASEYLSRLRGVVGAQDKRVSEVASLLGGGSTRTAAAPAPVAASSAEAEKPIATRAGAAPAKPADPSGAARAAGFVAFNRGDLGAAEQRFAEALRQRASDTDAAGGLGLVRLRQERFADAAELLGRAARGPGGERWREALSSAKFFAGLQTARADLAAGRLEKAATAARALSRSGGKDSIEASMVLGEALTAQQRYAEAADAYREVLARDPQRLEARAGLAEALSRTGQVDEAARLAADLPRTREGAAQRGRIERARADELQARGDAFGAGAALAASVAADPTNPWSRYQYARFLVGQGQAQQAAQVATPLFTAEAPDIDTLQAAALYAEFAGRPDQALALIGRIPAGARNPAVRELAQRLDVQAVIDRAKAQARTGQSVQAVATLRDYVAQNNLPFAARSRAAEALLDMGDGYQAGALALTAAREPLPEGVRPGDVAGFVNVLGAAGQDEAAAALLNATAQTARTVEEQTAWRQIYAGYSVRRADQLRQAGDYARAFDTLSAGFAVAPNSPDLLAGLGRLYQTGGMPDKAAQVFDALLRQRPRDPAVLLDAARAASSAGDQGRAASLLRMATELKPNDAELFYELGRIEQARGRDREALRALKRAEALLQGPPGMAGGGAAPRAGGMLGPNPFAGTGGSPIPGFAPASPAGAPAWPAPAPVYGVPANSNPAANFPGVTAAGPPSGLVSPAGYAGPGAAYPQAAYPQAAYPQAAYPQPAYPQPGGVYPPPFPQAAAAAQPTPGWLQPATPTRRQGAVDPSAPLGARIRGEIVNLQEDTAARIEGQFHARVRSGDSGTSELAEVSARGTVAASPFGRGRLGLVVEPVWINAGTPETYAAANLGTNPLLGAKPEDFPALKARSDMGAAMSVNYDSKSVHVDVGTTPLGFQTTNLNAGVVVSPKIGPVTVRASVQQRPVTDSVLSYAGDTDPLTGVESGGVVRQQAGLGVSSDFGRAGLYADAYAKKYRGRKVAENTAYEVNGGAYLRAYDDGENTLQLGVNVNFQSYDKNLRFFTLGHGGYFSPQTYVAAALPVTFTHKSDRWSFTGNLAPGLQSYTEDSSPVFPINSNLQTRLVTMTITNENAVPYYPSASRTGFGLAGKASGEYRVESRTFAGGEFAFDTFGRYSEYVFNIYLRQLLGTP